MGYLLHYITTAVARTGAQLLVVFGIVFALAIILWFVSQGIRGMVSSRIGMIYYYFVAPGVACHETGHALGCLLTGTKIAEFVPFKPSSDGTLGYVSNVFLAAWQMLRNAICVWNWRSPWIALYLYAVFCIASEITLSGPDLKGMWKGCAAIVVVFLGINPLPYVGGWLNAGIVWCKPYLFLVQVVLAFVLLMDAAFFGVAFLLTRLIKRSE